MASNVLVGYGGSSSSESDEVKAKDPQNDTISHDVLKSNENMETGKVIKIREKSPLPSGSDDQDEKRKVSKSYSSPSHDRKRSHRSDNSSSRHRHSGREHRSPDRHRHSRYERDRSRSPDRDRHHYSHSRHRQSDRHQEYHHHRRDRRHSRSTSPTRRSGHSSSQYKRDNNARRMSSGGEQTSYRDNSNRDNSKAEMNKPLENNAQTNLSPSSTSRPVQPALAVDSTDAETSREALIKSVLHGSQLINAAKAAIQNQKRKLLWSSKKKEDRSGSNWKGVSLGDDTAANRTSKFKRLMGMDDQGTDKQSVEQNPDELKVQNDDDNVQSVNSPEASSDKRTKLLNDLQQQYDAARLFTHTQRGFGLGFSSN